MSDLKEQLLIDYNYLLNKTLEISISMLNLANNEQVEQLLFECNNRERLIHNLNDLDQKIEQNYIKDIEFINNINKSKNDFINEINNINDKIVIILAQTKEKTAQEISSLYKNKKVIHSYNPSSVK
ncbi:MAG: hypothetical protein HQK51_18430 [Oligoflexia bacterium]|nr:hypothetical protein [Oligoflexia bacterium]